MTPLAKCDRCRTIGKNVIRSSKLCWRNVHKNTHLHVFPFSEMRALSNFLTDQIIQHPTNLQIIKCQWKKRQKQLSNENMKMVLLSQSSCFFCRLHFYLGSCGAAASSIVDVISARWASAITYCSIATISQPTTIRISHQCCIMEQITGL